MVGRGKYALVKLREVERLTDKFALHPVKHALEVLADHGVLDLGDTHDTDFFVIRIKDEFAAPALAAYAIGAVAKGEVVYGQDVMALASEAATHPNKHTPD